MTSTSTHPYARIVALGGYLAIAFVAFLFTVAIGTSAETLWLHFLIGAAGLAGPIVERSKYGEGSRLTRALRDPFIAAFGAIMAMAGPAGVGFAILRNAQASLPQTHLPVATGLVVSGAGMTLVIAFTVFSRIASNDPKLTRPVLAGILAPVAAVPLMLAILGAPMTPDDLFEARFGLPLDGVHAAHAGYSLLPDETFEATFGLTKGAYLAEWLKLRNEHPEFDSISLPGGDPA